MMRPRSENAARVRAATVGEALPAPGGAAQNGGSCNMEQDEANEVMRYVTSLNGDAMRWMNKRRPKKVGAKVLPRHVLPEIALQLKHMFDNFDYDHSGEIDLEELRLAVKFVADSCPPSTRQALSAQDTKAVINFFQTMDKDSNGVVDFVEFLAGITTQHGENNAIEVVRTTRRLQVAFLGFATQLRRLRIAQNLRCDELSSTQKLDSLKKLYSINYFVDSELDAKMDPVKYKKQLQEFNGGALQNRRKKELDRLHDAVVMIRSKSLQQVGHPPSRMESFPRVTWQGSNSTPLSSTAKMRSRNASAAVLPRITR